MTEEETKVSFDLGRVVATPGALAALEENNVSPDELLARHSKGDWGNLCEEDKEANNLALHSGSRILSAYFLPDETKIWVITDGVIDNKGSRYATTFLLPSEY